MCRLVKEIQLATVAAGIFILLSVGVSGKSIILKSKPVCDMLHPYYVLEFSIVRISQILPHTNSYIQ